VKATSVDLSLHLPGGCLLNMKWNFYCFTVTSRKDRPQETTEVILAGDTLRRSCSVGLSVLSSLFVALWMCYVQIN
jgi:hypothetical protein